MSLLTTFMHPAKTAEPIDMVFGWVTCGPRGTMC